MQRWKFESTSVGNAKIKPVYTATTFAFTTNAAADVQQIKANCRIDDLPAFIAKAQADAYRRRGNLDKGRMERQRQSTAGYPADAATLTRWIRRARAPGAIIPVSVQPEIQPMSIDLLAETAQAMVAAGQGHHRHR